MSNSVIRRVVAAVMPGSQKPSGAKPPASAPAASTFAGDFFESKRGKSLSLGGIEKLFEFLPSVFRSSSLPGPRLLHVDHGWTPQGQGYDAKRGELWVTYESGSEKYRHKVDRPREHIQRIPLEKLGQRLEG